MKINVTMIQRERERERETDRQTDRQSDSQKQRDRDRVREVRFVLYIEKWMSPVLDC